MSSDQSRLARRQVLKRCGGVSVTLLGVAAGSGTGAAASSISEQHSTAVASSVTQDDGDTENTPADVYDEYIDDVVLVNVFGGLDDEPGVPEGDGPETPAGIGSGFVVDDAVVTNHHVVREAETVELQFRDEQWRTADVVGTDIHSDLAALEVDDLPEETEGITLAEDEPTVGEEVLALGNPLGLDASISQGIVSGVNRSLPSPTGFSIPAAIQTDAPVNPGNSGGPLVDLSGDAVGVVFAGAGQTIGFAISAALANRVVPSLLEDGSYDHPYLGVSVAPVSPIVAEANDLEDARGVMVVGTVSDGPAADVFETAEPGPTVDGVPVPVDGDVIVAIDDTEIPSQERLSSTLALETEPDETITIDVLRDGDEETVELTLEERPSETDF
ncbi:S1C family serine protease [Natronorubrum sediminis]|nr:trypsin-like peptidase domain-containing protein [Natronorubrum sediminis]